MKKLINTFIFFIGFFFIFINHINALEIESQNAILINNKDDIVVFDKNAEEKIFPASLTKIMTVIVSLENIKDIKKEVTLKDEMFKGIYETGASVAGFQPNETVTYEDLLYGAMLPSGADATNCLALLQYDTMENFINAMNKKAKELGMKNTHFVNCTGLHDGNHYSTVKDIAILLQYAIKNEEFKTIFTTKTYTSGKHTFHSTISKYNVLDDIALGGKTGFTNEAGLCLATIAEDEGVEWLLITAHAPSGTGKSLHAIDQANIYNYYFDLYNYQTIIKKNTKLGNVKIKQGKEKSLKLISSENIKVYDTVIDSNKLSFKFDKSFLTAPINKNDIIGSMDIFYNNKNIYSTDIYATKSVDKDYLALAVCYFKKYYFVLFIVFFLIILIKFKRNIAIFYRNCKKMIKRKKSKN